MGDSRFLFERLAATDDQAFDLARAVVEQVERLTTTLSLVGVEAALLSTPDLLSMGLPSVVDLGDCSPAELSAHAESLRRQLLVWEPRLRDIKVRLSGKPAVLELQARLQATDGEAQPMRLRLPLGAREMA